MLLELKVSHFAIIDNIELSFKPGLNILSGETGAGKSVLLKSLALLMGGKAHTDSIRTGHQQATIEGSFDISQRSDLQKKLQLLGIETEDDLLIVRRVIAGNDKSRVYINNTLAPLQTLRDLISPLIEITGQESAPLIEMTGQHENRNLVSKSYHLDLLDQYCETWELRSKYEKDWQHLHTLNQELQTIVQNTQLREQRIDYLQFQRDEIVSVQPGPGEDQQLEQQLKRLRQSHKLVAFAESAEAALMSDEDSALQRINGLLKRTSELQNLAPELEPQFELLRQAKVSLEEMLYETQKFIQSQDNDSENLEKIESRLSQIRKLQKKYGTDSNEILKSLVDIENELAQLQSAEKRKLQIEKEMSDLKKRMFEAAKELSKRRQQGATLLEKSVQKELLDLNMKGVQFVVNSEKLQELTATGLDSFEFMTKNSPTDPARALSKAASGGELSRILLSLKKVIGTGELPRTYLFDEVDTGVSGPTAEKVGKKLHSIAQGQQVICITHLPQVAAYGDVHFFIQKAPQKNSISMQVDELDRKARTQEIARLISGEKLTKTSLAHAEQLLKEANAL